MRHILRTIPLGRQPRTRSTTFSFRLGTHLHRFLHALDGFSSFLRHLQRRIHPLFRSLLCLTTPFVSHRSIHQSFPWVVHPHHLAGLLPRTTEVRLSGIDRTVFEATGGGCRCRRGSAWPGASHRRRRRRGRAKPPFQQDRLRVVAW